MSPRDHQGALVDARSLVGGGLVVGGIVWLLFGLAPFIARGGVMAACWGPTGWPEHLAATGVTAGLIGLALLGSSVWLVTLRPRSERTIMWAFPVAYVAALLVFCFLVAPAIWGAPGCGGGPIWDML